MQRHRAEAGDDPEQDEARRADAIRERRAEGHEPNHVEKQMREAAVQERVGDGAGERPEIDVERAGIADWNEGRSDQKFEILLRR